MENKNCVGENKPLVYKYSDGDLNIEYELVTVFQSQDVRFNDIGCKLEQLTRELDENREELQIIKNEIYNNTSHADKTDYIVAACCGIICGLIDVFFVGKFNFKGAKAWSNKAVNEFVEDIAKNDGYRGDGGLKGAIKYLEDKYKVPNDSSYENAGIGVSSKTHHLDDMAHHPTIIGLIFSLLTQFTSKAYFSNSAGEFSVENVNESLIGKTFGEKMYRGVVFWFFHLVSDMSGSNKTAGEGMGIPGPILSLAKEISSLPGVNKTDLPKILNELYKNEHFDLRSELAVAHELGRQAIPVIINEILVRGFYFIRRFFAEWNEKQNLSKIEWDRVKPFNNAIITRMLTIASGTFLIVDAGEAALKSGGNIYGFILRINFVNLFRFSMAVGSELSYAIKREKLGEQYFRKLITRNEIYNSKLHYQGYAILLVAKDTLKTISDTYNLFYQYAEEYRETEERINNRIDYLKQKYSSDLADSMTFEERMRYLQK